MSTNIMFKGHILLEVNFNLTLQLPNIWVVCESLIMIVLGSLKEVYTLN